MKKRMKVYWKKVVSILLIGMVTACWIQGAVSAPFVFAEDIWDGTADIGWYEKGATTLSIDTPQEFAGLSELVNSGINFSGVTIELEADLTMNDTTNWEDWQTGAVVPEQEWTPIGIFNQCIFHGTFDGNGHSISGLYAETSDKSGMFIAIAAEAVVTDVVLEESYLCSVNDYAGGICGYNFYGTITNCHNRGAVASWYYTAGGICGANYFGKVQQCSNTGTISASVNGGGIAGINFSAAIENSVNQGNISANQYAGGIAGEESTGIIRNSYNLGNVKSTVAAGGLVAKYDGGMFENCYHAGMVSGTETQGAMAVDADAICANCYYLLDSVENAVDGAHCYTMQQEDMQTVAFAERLKDAYYGEEGVYPRLTWEAGLPDTSDTTTTVMTTTVPTETTAESTTTGGISIATVNNVKTISEIGGTLQLFLVGTEDTPLWTSTNEEIASIDETGLVTAVSAGAVILGAMVGNKHYWITLSIAPGGTATTAISTSTDMTVTETTTETSKDTTTTKKTTTETSKDTTTTKKTTTETSRDTTTTKKTTTTETSRDTTTTKKTTTTETSKDTTTTKKTTTETSKDTTTTKKTTTETSKDITTTKKTTTETSKDTTTVVTTETTTTSSVPAGKAYDKGDVNGDVQVNVEDAISVLTYYTKRSVGLTPIFSESPMQQAKAMIAADVNEDDAITVEDAVKILTYYANASAGLKFDWEDILS